ncbi:MAG: hypothetical protein Kow0068_13950 [Marinilabiliales bacterium]
MQMKKISIFMTLLTIIALYVNFSEYLPTLDDRFYNIPVTIQCEEILKEICPGFNYFDYKYHSFIKPSDGQITYLHIDSNKVITQITIRTKFGKYKAYFERWCDIKSDKSDNKDTVLIETSHIGNISYEINKNDKIVIIKKVKIKNIKFNLCSNKKTILEIFYDQ